MDNILQAVSDGRNKLGTAVRGWFARKQLSLWFIVASLILSAITMQPSFTSLIIVIINGVLLLVARKIAHLEGDL